MQAGGPHRPGLQAQAGAYAALLAANADAFADLVGAEGAVTAWKRDMLAARSSPATVNQALAAVTLMYEQIGLRIAVKRVRVPRPGETGALSRQQEAALRRAAALRGPRDSAIIAVPLDAGAPVEECARLDADDFAITARTGEIRMPDPLRGVGPVESAPVCSMTSRFRATWPSCCGDQGGVEEVEHVLRDGIAVGHHLASDHLCDFLRAAGRDDEAVRLHRYGLNLDGTAAGLQVAPENRSV